MDRQKETYSYTYSARQQDEVRRIYEQYAPKGEKSLEKLKRLDRSATVVAAGVAIAVSFIGILLILFGVCGMILWKKFIFLGALIAIPGLTAVIAARPLYGWLAAKRRQKIAPEVLALCRELMK